MLVYRSTKYKFCGLVMMAVAQVLLTVIEGLSSVLGKPLNEANLFEGYPQLCLTIDEVINEVYH